MFLRVKICITPANEAVERADAMAKVLDVFLGELIVTTLFPILSKFFE